VAYTEQTECRPVYHAAERFVEAALRHDDSLFTPGRTIWAKTNADVLYTRFVSQPDLSKDSFLTKLERQMGKAPGPLREQFGIARDEVIQLLAEIAYVHLVIARDFGGPAKRDVINPILGWMSEAVVIPDDLDRLRDIGLMATGVAFRTYRPHQLWFIIEFIRSWKAAATADRERMLADPWALKAFLFEVPISSAYTQREALLHLVHPQTFEDIVSRDHKQRIVKAFRDRLSGDPEDVDRALLQIRSSFEEEYGEKFSFYMHPLVERWRAGETTYEPEEVSPGERRAWLIRGSNVRGTSRIDRWLTGAYCSIGWDEAGDIGPGSSREEIRARLANAFPDHKSGWIANSAGNVDRFLNRVKLGDVVVTADGADVYVGVITSAPAWLEGDEPGEARRRSVEWANPGRPIRREDLSGSAYSKLRTLLTVTDVSQDIAEWARLAGLSGDIPPTPQEEVAATTAVQLPAPASVLADRLLLPQSWLEEVCGLLAEKQQLVFYGPPGTGKTYVAQQLAAHLTSQGGNHLLVQFHPSYAYEDFFEGYRPREGTAGTIAFELVPGPLRELAEAAEEDRSHPYVLIIDEINRGNLAKIFGELYFLLEYRDQAIQLQYSRDALFKLPPNLLIIGTMNTADRSIALVDAAMRRRFYFVPFLPSRPPIDGLLQRWLEHRHLPTDAARLLRELNERIGDPDFSIGPSYLMTERLAQPGVIERIWKYAILPLLQEQFFGTTIDVEDKFGIATLRRATAGTAGGGGPARAALGDPVVDATGGESRSGAV
jgi:5-methylcytosine-specific restriction enzyme B